MRLQKKPHWNKQPSRSMSVAEEAGEESHYETVLSNYATEQRKERKRDCNITIPIKTQQESSRDENSDCINSSTSQLSDEYADCASQQSSARHEGVQLSPTGSERSESTSKHLDQASENSSRSSDKRPSSIFLTAPDDPIDDDQLDGDQDSSFRQNHHIYSEYEQERLHLALHPRKPLHSLQKNNVTRQDNDLNRENSHAVSGTSFGSQNNPWRVHANHSYYKLLPFAPGPEMLFHLRPLRMSKRDLGSPGRPASPTKAGASSSSSSKTRDGLLHIRIPETAIFGRRGKRMLLRYNAKSQGIIKESLDSDKWEENLSRRWTERAKPIGEEREPIVALLKLASWKHLEGTETRAVNRATLLSKFEQRPDVCIFQRFIKPKGAKPSVYRATWRRYRPAVVVNIAGVRSYINASRFVQNSEGAGIFEENDAGSLTSKDLTKNVKSSAPRAQHFMEERLLSAWFCPSAADKDRTSTFRVANSAVEEVSEALDNLVKHMEASISYDYGLSCFGFEQLQCDFVRSSKNEWVLTSIRGFELTSEAFREASQIELAIQQRRAEQGDYYDSEEEEAQVIQRRHLIRQTHATKRAKALAVIGGPLSRPCSMCNRPIGSKNEKLESIPDLENTIGNFIPESKQVNQMKTEEIGSFPGSPISPQMGALPARDGLKSPVARSPSQKNAVHETTNFMPFELTTVLARGLRKQLLLRGQRVKIFDNCSFAKVDERFNSSELQPGSSAVIGNSFQVCDLCHNIWKANENLLELGKQVGISWLPGTSATDRKMVINDIVTPGAPCYGAKPGSRVAYSYSGSIEDHFQPASLNARLTSTTAGAMADFESRQPKSIPDSTRVQYRLAVFLQDIQDAPSGKFKIQYSFHPWAGPVDVEVTEQALERESCNVRQVRVHYFASNRSGLQQLFMQPWRLHVLVDGKRCFTGELFLTRFLASFSSHSLVNFNLKLSTVENGKVEDSLNAEVERQKPTLRCAIGIIRDPIQLGQLDTGLPLTVDNAVLHYPPNYFDLRPLPEFWLSSIVNEHERIGEEAEASGGVQNENAISKKHSHFIGSKRPTRSRDVREETQQVIKEIVAEASRQRTNRSLLEDHTAQNEAGWKHVQNFYMEVSQSCGGAPVTRTRLIQEAMQRARKADQAPGLVDKNSVDWSALVALLQDGTLNAQHHSFHESDFSDLDLKHIAMRRASECMVFTKESFIAYIENRLNEISKQSANLGLQGIPEPDNSAATANASASAWSIGLFSRRLKKEAVMRRYLRYRAYTRIWACIDIDQSGRIDAAELRAYVQQRQLLDKPHDIYIKSFADWSLRDMHAHFCSWIGQSARTNQKFSRYDADGSGLITWEEFVAMADRAFREVALDELSFSVSQGFGHCDRHGETKVYSVDLACVSCEIAKHNPSHAWDNEMFASLDQEVLSKVKSAAGRMLRRLSYSVYDESSPMVVQQFHRNGTASESVLGILNPAHVTGRGDAESTGMPGIKSVMERKDRSHSPRMEASQSGTEVESKVEGGVSDAPRKTLTMRTPSLETMLEEDDENNSTSSVRKDEQGIGDADQADDDPSESPKSKKLRKNNAKPKSSKKSKNVAKSKKKSVSISVPKQSKDTDSRKTSKSLSKSKTFKTLFSETKVSSGNINKLSSSASTGRLLGKNSRNVRKRSSVRQTKLPSFSKTSSKFDSRMVFIPAPIVSQQNESAGSSYKNAQLASSTNRKRSTLSLGSSSSLNTKLSQEDKNCAGTKDTRNFADNQDSIHESLSFLETVTSDVTEFRDQHCARPMLSGRKSKRELSAKLERKESMKLLHHAEIEAFFMYAKHGNVEQAKSLLQMQRLDPNVRFQGRSPLHVAAAAGQNEIIRLLLFHGADPRVQDAAGQVAADVARSAGHENLTVILNRWLQHYK